MPTIGHELAKELPHVHTVGEAAESARNAGLLLGGKSLAGSVGAAVGTGGSGIGTAAGGVSGVAATAGGTLATAVTLGLTAAVSASVVAIQHNSDKKHTAQFYKNELGAKLGKAPKKVGAKDLEKMASGSIMEGLPSNQIMSEHLTQSKRRRNLGIALSVIASVATFAIFESLAIKAEGVLPVIAKGAMGLATYFGIKAPLHWLGDKVMGTDKETTHERIVEIAKDRAKGKVVGKEQVFSVFVAANPDIAGVIQDKFGKVYDDLELRDKQRVTQDFGDSLNIGAITRGINEGKMAAEELAFAAVGQESGAQAPIDRPIKKGVIAKVKDKLLGKGERKEAETAEEQAPERSFADRVGRKTSAGMSHLERLEANRAAVSATTEIK